MDNGGHHLPRPGKQTITPRDALSGRSTSLFTYIKCVFQKYEHKLPYDRRIM